MGLPEALAIVDRLHCDGHIAPDLYAVFVNSGIYRKYAEAFLDARQVGC